MFCLGLTFVRSIRRHIIPTANPCQCLRCLLSSPFFCSLTTFDLGWLLMESLGAEWLTSYSEHILLVPRLFKIP